MNLRDHSPIKFDAFNGLWDRGDVDNTPLDHFADGNNIRFVGTSDFTVRDGIGISQTVGVPLENIKRIYNYPTNTANTLIVLIENGAGDGEIYHVVDINTVYGPLLTLTGMADFAFVPYGGRGYISPIGYYTQGDLNIEKGLENEFLYVYAGDGTAARQAAGAPYAGNITIVNGAAGHTDPGMHIFGFVYETISGFLSAPFSLETFVTSAGSSVSFGNVPTGGDPNVVARHLVASKIITTFDGNLEGYQLFFVPNATIANDTDTFLNNISFYDSELLEDASYLFDNFDEIPAGAALTLYRDRLCIFATFDDFSIGYASTPGEPEAINEITGLIEITPDGNPITQAQELRDILYVFKRSKTYSLVDNDSDPTSWPQTVIDNALGCPIHGIATVLDSGSSSVDYLIVTTYQGISLFNGKYIPPELSWKIEAFWKRQDRDEFRKIQIINAPIQKWILTILPDRRILYGDYANGMDPKKIRWMPWSFIMGVNTIAIVNIDEIIFGSDLVTP